MPDLECLTPALRKWPQFGAAPLNWACRKVAQERLYKHGDNAGCATTGEFANLSELTGLRTFVTSFVALAMPRRLRRAVIEDYVAPLRSGCCRPWPCGRRLCARL